MGETQPPATPKEKTEAHKIVDRSGIPFNQALLVVRGVLSLNEVLKEMWALQRRDQLIDEGVLPTLAGQVARGRLLREKARLIQELWDIQKAPFGSDRLSEFVEGPLMALSLFGKGMAGGTVTRLSRYDVTIRPENSAELVNLKKHELKFYCLAKNAADVLPLVGRDPRVASMNLGSSTDMMERFRPTEELAIDWVQNRRKMLFFFRDGEFMIGVPVRVARFEIELDIGKGIPVTLLTHSLYKPQPYRHSDGDE